MNRISFCSLFVLIGCVTTPESGRTAFIVTSETEENQIGAQAFQQVLSQERLSSNARWAGILKRVGERIASVANREDFQWEFRLVESREKNAFCLPGGKIAFYTGIFPVAQNEAGLAAVMGHEIAHATARHAGQRMTLAFGTGLAFEGLSAILGGQTNSQRKQLLMGALGVGTQIGVALPFNRSMESEADQIGLIYMARAGYDPAEALEFWRRMSEGDTGMPKFLSTHPPSEERFEALDSQIRSVQSAYNRSPKYGQGEKL